MFEEILGKHKPCKMNTASSGDTRPVSFGDVWEDKQRAINRNFDVDDDIVEDLQIDGFEW